MPDRIKEALDLQWHNTLDLLNAAYEEAYDSYISNQRRGHHSGLAGFTCKQGGLEVDCHIVITQPPTRLEEPRSE